MKKPYLNREQRQSIYADTYAGSILLLGLSVQRLRRDVYK